MNTLRIGVVVALCAAAGCGKGAGKAVGVWLDRAGTALKAYQRYEEVKAAFAPAPRPRFPHPASSVRPTSPHPLAAGPGGVYAFPNNYHGFCLYDGAGRALGFSAWDPATGEERYYDPFGNGL